jgi:glycosyltransferase involved in cell wall biosynthesis
MQQLLPGSITGHYNWESYQLVDASVALTPHEAHLMRYVLRAPPDRVHVVPNGVEGVFLQSKPEPRGRWLVCTATITPLKRITVAADAAVAAHIPLWVIGRPYTESDPYYLRFRQLVQAHPDLLRFEGPVHDRQQLARIYRQARGFVLLSAWESLSLSALEAAACECPLLLSDLPWARGTFGERAAYCPVTTRRDVTTNCLRLFYKQADQTLRPPKPASWTDVAHQLKTIYSNICQPRCP